MKARTEIDLLCWIDKPRNHGRLVFCDVVDNNGKIQAIFDRVLAEDAASAASFVPEIGPEVDVNFILLDGRL